MKVRRKTNLYKRLKKMLDNGGEDRVLGKELLLSTIDKIHPDDWYNLNNMYNWSNTKYWEADEIQRYLYDKRKQEESSISEARQNISGK